MSKCLVLQLKGVINDSELPYFNSIVFGIKSIAGNSGVRFAFVNTKANTTIKILDEDSGAYLSDETSANYGSEHTYSANSYPWLRGTISNFVRVQLFTKDLFTGFANDSDRAVAINVEHLSGCENLTTFLGTGYDDISGKLSKIADTSLASLRLYIDNDLSEVASITTLSEVYLNIGKMYGDIKYLASLPLLDTLHVTNAKVTGDLKEYIDLRREKCSQTSGSMSSVLFNNGKMTFNGTLVTLNPAFVVEWDATSIIAKKDSLHTAYVYNITSEQRESLTNDGYTTIVDV